MNFDKENNLKLDVNSDMSLSQEISSVRKVNYFVRKYYPWLAISAGIIYGSQVFIQKILLESVQNTNSIAIFMPIFVGYAMTGAVYHSNVAIKSYKKHGKVWHK